MSNLNIFNYSITAKNYGEIIHTALHSGSSGSPFVISTLNVPMLKEAHYNREYTKALNSSNVIVPDGIGFVWASKLLYGKQGLNGRVTGPDLFLKFCQEAELQRLKFFFLGSTPEVLSQIKEKINKQYKRIEVVGMVSPPFGQWSEETNQAIISKINGAMPDVLWVGMTAPRQETWIGQNKSQLRVRVIGAIGAAFDFFAGSRQRAPLWVQKIGLEWFYRITQEPLRIGRRYAGSIPYFLISVLKHWLNGDK